MKQYTKFTNLFFMALFSFVLFSCSEDNEETEYEYDKHYVNKQPTEDEVKTQFSGKVALLQENNDNVLEYLNKRLINTATELTENTDVVVMDEAKVQSLLNNETEYGILRKLWNSNKVMVFINPGSDAFTLVERLKQLDPTASVAAPTESDLDQFKNIHVYATRADGAALYHEKVDNPRSTAHGIICEVTEEGEKEIFNGQIASTHKPNEYNKGRLAENVAAWLNERALLGEQHDVAFVRSDNSYSVEPTPVTFYFSINITHDWFKEYSPKDAKVPSSTMVDAKAHLEIYGTYSTTRNCDVYDINIYEEFPANKTCIEDKYVHEFLAYNYKYTGGCYSGPTVDLRLKDIPKPSIEVEEAAPLPQTDGKYNNTHYPMQIGFGGSLQGNLSATPGLSAGLSVSCQLPHTTTSFNHAEMPIDFSNDDKHAKWTYSTDYRAYKWMWGINPTFINIPDVVKSFCKTDQAVTFIVNNTKSYGEKSVTLLLDLQWNFFSEYADPWEHWTFRPREVIPYLSTKMPKVNRYFDKYTPYPLPGYSDIGDGSEWGNLEERLMRNINYRALCDETLQVGAQTEKGLDVTAENIWRTAIESLVTQYNGTKTTYEYVIALARTNGTHIELGLHIKDGLWRLIEDVDHIDK